MLIYFLDIERTNHKMRANKLIYFIFLLATVRGSFSFVSNPRVFRPCRRTVVAFTDVAVVNKESSGTTTTIAPAASVKSSLSLYSSIFEFPSSNSFEEDKTTSSSYVNSRHSALDWLYNVRSLPQSRVLKETRGPVVTVTIWSAFVSVVRSVLLNSHRSSWQALGASMSIPPVAHSFLSSLIGLLLVFRTNSAYQRFYEGRKIWENILSVSRNLSRMIQLYTNEVGNARKHKIINKIAAYPYLLRHHIWKGCLCKYENENAIPNVGDRLLLHEPPLKIIETRHEGDKDECNGGTTRPELDFTSIPPKECWVDRTSLPWNLFAVNEQERLARTINRPLWVCDEIGKDIMEIPYTPNFTSRERLTLLSKVEKLTDAIGQCERIHQTTVPLNYARHSLRSLTLWSLTLPFALVKDLGLITCLASGTITWLLFGVYQIGYSIEDPFQGSLRLSILCDAIRRDVFTDIDESSSAKSNKADGINRSTTWNSSSPSPTTVDFHDDETGNETNNNDDSLVAEKRKYEELYESEIQPIVTSSNHLYHHAFTTTGLSSKSRNNNITVVLDQNNRKP